jgi:hypothetical protein
VDYCVGEGLGEIGEPEMRSEQAAHAVHGGAGSERIDGDAGQRPEL